MYICYEKSFNFIHVPKTAGTSILRLLRDAYSLDMQLGEHEAFSDIYDSHLSTSDLWDSHFNFAFVRNPWSRLLSAFNYLNDGGRNFDDNRVANLYVQPYEGDFNAFVADSPRWFGKRIHFLKYGHKRSPHFMPQADFITTPCKNLRRVMLDFVGRFESLGKDLGYISDKLKLNLGELPHLNKSEKVDYRLVYTDSSIDKVSKLYAEDIGIFDYTF